MLHIAGSTRNFQCETNSWSLQCGLDLSRGRGHSGAIVGCVSRAWAAPCVAPLLAVAGDLSTAATNASGKLGGQFCGRDRRRRQAGERVELDQLGIALAKARAETRGQGEAQPHRARPGALFSAPFPAEEAQRRTSLRKRFGL